MATKTKVDWQKVEQAAKLLDQAGMPYLAAMARRGGTAADELLAGTVEHCDKCPLTYRVSEKDKHQCVDASQFGAW